MKNIHLPIFAILMTALILWGCKEKESEAQAQKFDKDTSYAFGMVYGSEIRENIDLGSYKTNYNEFMKGFTDGFYEKKTRFDMEEAMVLIRAAFKLMSDEMLAQREQNEVSFLAENSKRSGITITPSGLQYEVIKEGTGRKPSKDSTVLVHYTGTYTDGSLFDSSHERGAPLELNLYDVIPGWAEGLQLMSVGSHYILYIPSEIGYGPEGRVNPLTGMQMIPPYATLIFDVELIDIN